MYNQELQEFHFSNNDCEVVKDDELRAYATLNGNIYRLVAGASAVSSITNKNLNYDIWHRRLGHLRQGNVTLLHDKE